MTHEQVLELVAKYAGEDPELERRLLANALEIIQDKPPPFGFERVELTPAVLENYMILAVLEYEMGKVKQ